MGYTRSNNERNSWKNDPELVKLYKKGEFWQDIEGILSDVLSTEIFEQLEFDNLYLNSVKLIVVQGAIDSGIRTSVLSNSDNDVYIFHSKETAKSFIGEVLPGLEIGKDISIAHIEDILIPTDRKEILVQKLLGESLYKIGEHIYGKGKIKIKEDI